MARTKQVPSDPLERAEMVSILEQIAREGGDTARIQAIKTLIAIQDQDTTPASGLDALDELAPRRNSRQAP